MNRKLLGAMLMALSLVLPAMGQDEKKDALTPAQRLAIADQAMSGLVTVEYTLQYDKGESPSGRGKDMEAAIRDERPLEVEGWLLSPTEVVTRDTQLDRRFIKGLAVRFGEKTVPAEIVGYYKQNSAVLLKLDQPLAGAKPLAFKADSKGPLYYVDRSQSDGHWVTSVIPVEMNTVSRTDADRKFISSAAIYALVVDKAGNPVGLQMKFEYPLDDSWKGSPANWPMFSADDMAKLVSDVQAKADQGLLRVKLHFRSPKKGQVRESGPTEHTCAGLLLEPRKLLVLASLDPKLTARLEPDQIEVFSASAGGSEASAAGPASATFAGTLTDYGCFVATLEKPLPGPVKLSTQPIENYRDTLLLALDMRLQGDQRVVYCLRDRLSRFEQGWKRRIFPENYSSHFLFDPATGQIVALPVTHREKVAVRESYGAQSRNLMPASYLAEALADLPKSFDPANVPLTEDQENRLAWLGVELQAMNPELARANKVSDLTQNGANGAIVAWVYPASPAAKAGVQPGWILIRLQVADQPKPIDIKLEYAANYLPNFPWEQLDRVPEQSYDQIPRPWPPLENSFNRVLTDLGFGKQFKAEFWADGKLITKDFTIEQSPLHFDTAPRYESKNIGLTVRDMTYEVRRYFRKQLEDPGVIISKVEPGSKSAVAGLKPFELVTKVNDQPVRNVKEFEDLLNKTQGKLQLYIMRMADGRPVKMDLAAPIPATRPAVARPAVPAPDDDQTP